MIGPLRRRDFSLLFWGGFISVAGDWLLFAVLPYVVYVRTGSTLATAGMTVSELAPGIVLGSIAGVVVDRWDRRRLLIVVNALQALVVLALLTFVAAAYLPVVYAVAAAQSALSAFSMPAENALLPTLVEPDELVTANALNLFNDRVGRLAGLALGPLVYAFGGLGAVTVVDSGTFLVASLLIGLMRTRSAVPDGSTPHRGTFFVEWREGLLIVRDAPSIAMLFVIFALMTFGGTMLDPLQAPWVRDVLHGGPGVYALLKTIHAASGIAGSLVMVAIGSRVSPRLLCGAGSVLAGVLLLVRFNVPVVAVAVALSAVAGAIAVGSSVGVETLAQQRVPEPYRGRVFGTLQATIWLASLLGAVIGGVGAAWVGVVEMLNIAALLVLVAGLVVLLALPSHQPNHPD